MILESLAEVGAVLVVFLVEIDIRSHLKSAKYFLSAAEILEIFLKSDQSAVGWLAGPEVAGQRSPGIISRALAIVRSDFTPQKGRSKMLRHILSSRSKNRKRHFWIND